MDESTITEMENVLKEMSGMATSLTIGYSAANALQILRIRSSNMGRLCFLGEKIDRWYNNKAAEITAANAQIPEWKFKIEIGKTIEGRLNALRRRLSDTIELQCENLKIELIEMQSDRKHSKDQK